MTVDSPVDAHQALLQQLVREPLRALATLRGRYLSRSELDETFPELWPVVQHLLQELMSQRVQSAVGDNAALVVQYKLALQELRHVAIVNRDLLPYDETIRAIMRVVEFFDVLVRCELLEEDPVDLSVLAHEEENPRLRRHAYYHRYRYLYHVGRLLRRLPDIFLLPSHESFSVMDMMRFRCVPVFVLGVTTGLIFVDEFDQTPVEFLIHDVNHARRQVLANDRWMDQHGIQTAEERQQAYEASYEFSSRLLDSLEYEPDDTEEQQALKDLKRVILFEIVHEDADFFMPDVISSSLQRREGFASEFEVPVIDPRTGLMDVRDTQETGIATLSYVRQKLQNGFYDRIGSTGKGIVARRYRTTSYIARAAYELLVTIDARPERPDVDQDAEGRVSYSWLLERACSYGPEIVHESDINDEEFARLAPHVIEVNIKNYFDTETSVAERVEQGVSAQAAPTVRRPPLAEIRLTADALLYRHAATGELQILLQRRALEPYKGTWALPGAFVWAGETTADTAARAVADKVGLTGVALRQFGLFDSPGRDPRARVGSALYIGQVPAAEAEALGENQGTWFAVDDLPKLAFDHATIIAAVRQTTQLAR